MVLFRGNCETAMQAGKPCCQWPVAALIRMLKFQKTLVKGINNKRLPAIELQQVRTLEVGTIDDLCWPLAVEMLTKVARINGVGGARMISNSLAIATANF